MPEPPLLPAGMCQLLLWQIVSHCLFSVLLMHHNRLWEGCATMIIQKNLEINRILMWKSHDYIMYRCVLTELLVFVYICAGPPVWTPSCLALWLHFTKPRCPAALCRDTSHSWITSHASATTSSQFTSAQIVPVRAQEIFPHFPNTHTHTGR